jgi:beta-phosphoglucomutase
MKKDIKAIIFDHDNTIAQTEALWMLAIHNLLKDRGIALSTKQLKDLEKDLLGLGVSLATQFLIDTFALEDSFEDLRDEKCKRVREQYKTDLSFMPGFVPFFEKVKKTDLKVAIASNSDHHSLSLSAETLGLHALFGQHIYNESHVSQPKPHPEIYLLAARMLEVNPKECLAIEDSPPGIEAAQKAGIFCIGLNSSENREMIAKADLVVASYDEIDLSVFTVF